MLTVACAALLAGAAFVFGAWFGHVAAWRAVAQRVRSLARVALARLWGEECASEPFLSELAGAMLEELELEEGRACRHELGTADGGTMLVRFKPPCAECERGELARALEVVGECELELAERSLGRVIPCATCGPGVVCSTCRARDAAKDRLRAALERLAACAHARARLRARERFDVAR
jgi:hypothetical protein